MSNSATPIMSARGLSKVFRPKSPDPIEVLKAVDLDICESDKIAIVGKSGTGKSTLLHLLGTLESPSSGSLHYLGQDVFAFGEQRLAAFRNRELGFVFQFHYLMVEFTAVENVMIPALISGQSRKQANDRARQLLDKVGLSSRLDHKPNQLSGGEQQRVAIARALMMQPKILLTDEMTGNLDPDTGMRIFDLVHSIHSEFKMSLVSVTHDMQMTYNYDRTYELERGSLRPAR